MEPVVHIVAVFEIDFDTFVADFAYVGHSGVTVTDMSRGIDTHQHIVGITDEAIDRSGEFSVPEVEVNSEAPLLGVLPVTAVVDPGQDCGACRQGLLLSEDIVNECRAVVEDVEDEGIVADIIVSYLTPAETSFRLE